MWVPCGFTPAHRRNSACSRNASEQDGSQVWSASLPLLSTQDFCVQLYLSPLGARKGESWKAPSCPPLLLGLVEQGTHWVLSGSLGMALRGVHSVSP